MPSIKTYQIQNFALFWDCCKRPKSIISGNLSKNCCVWAAQWPTSSELKTKFDPSLDRSWCEFFKIMKDHGLKNPPPGCNLGALFPSPSWIFFKKISVLSIYIVFLDLSRWKGDICHPGWVATPQPQWVQSLSEVAFAV